jgi:hypothetical protein
MLDIEHQQGDTQMTKATLRKLETIIVKMECVTPEINDREIRHKLVQLKSQMINLLREAEGT